MRAALLIASALASATCMVIGPVTSKVEVTGSGALQVTPPLRAYAGAHARLPACPPPPSQSVAQSVDMCPCVTPSAAQRVSVWCDRRG